MGLSPHHNLVHYLKTATALGIHDYDSAVASLMGRINYEQTAQIPYRSREFKLQRMEQLLELVGNPHRQLPAVHIAGTKGKGSTAVMVDAMLRAGGYRTGLYTSPHLEHIEERFALGGAPCCEEAFIRAAQSVESAADQLDAMFTAQGRTGPTYFEMTTAIAMLIFAEAEVDVAVLEVGLGGRLDSTNVCHPLVSVITSISFDHTKQLGNTISAIAREKAGIIKQGVPVICGAGDEEATNVIREVAQHNGCELRELDVDFGALTARDSFTYWESEEGEIREIDHCSPAMLGKHQQTNAAIAIAAIRKLANHQLTVSDEAIRGGLSSASCPGRVEVVSRKPPVLLDAAHNVASCQALVEVIELHFPDQMNRTLILATSNDKDAGGMIRALLPAFRRIIFTRYLSNPRAADPLDLKQKAEAILDADDLTLEIAETPTAALEKFHKDAQPDELLCVSGSFFLAGEVRKLLTIATTAAPAKEG